MIKIPAMETTENIKSTYHIEILQTLFQGKKRNNSAYSLRAFAKSLELSSSVLSEVLNGKRSIPRERIDDLSKKLQLSDLEAKRFKQSATRWNLNLQKLAQIKSSGNKTLLLDNQKHFSIIAEWDYYAFLSLLETEDVIHENAWFAKRLGISIERIRTIIKDLKTYKLISVNDEGMICLSGHQLTTSKDISSKALRAAHQQALDLAKEKLESVPLDLRYFSSITMAVDPDKLPEAKELIREFRQKLSDLLEKEDKKEVYQLCIQLYPLTQIEGGK